jgi:microcystin-dependent protein
MSLWEWSKTAASNSTADSTINWAEGQAPSTVNDSARSMMARIAEYRDDISGVIVTGGASTAYTVTSNQVFDSLAHMDGAMIAFTPHTTSGDAPTLNVDGLGAKKIRIVPSVDIPGGALVEGTPYVATYYNTAGEFILHNLGGNPYSVPLGSSLDYWGTAAPNSAFALPYGQAISRATYASLYTLLGTTFGSGDGSTTFNLPDLRGRVTAGADAMGGSAANRLTAASMSTTGLGGAGGAQTVALTTSEMPSHYHSAGISESAHVHSYIGGVLNTTSGTFFLNLSNSGANAIYKYDTATVAGNTTGVSVTSSNGAGTTYSTGGGAAHQNVQPTLICNKIIRIK